MWPSIEPPTPHPWPHIVPLTRSSCSTLTVVCPSPISHLSRVGTFSGPTSATDFPLSLKPNHPALENKLLPPRALFSIPARAQLPWLPRDPLLGDPPSKGTHMNGWIRRNVRPQPASWLPHLSASVQRPSPQRVMLDA